MSYMPEPPITAILVCPIQHTPLFRQNAAPVPFVQQVRAVAQFQALNSARTLTAPR